MTTTDNTKNCKGCGTDLSEMCPVTCPERAAFYASYAAACANTRPPKKKKGA